MTSRPPPAIPYETRVLCPNVIGVVRNDPKPDILIDLEGAEIRWHPNQGVTSGMQGLLVRPGHDTFTMAFDKALKDPWNAWLAAEMEALRFRVNDVEFTIESVISIGHVMHYVARGRRVSP